MRISRQNKILELIETHEIETQDKLAAMLRDEGFEVPYLVSLSNSPAVLMDMMCFVRDKTRRVRDEVPLSMNLVDKRLKKLVRAFLDMKDEDEEGFTYNTRATLDLEFLDEADRETEEWLTLWREVKGA